MSHPLPLFSHEKSERKSAMVEKISQEIIIFNFEHSRQPQIIFHKIRKKIFHDLQKCWEIEGEGEDLNNKKSY
jgi:hypothetical protein